MDLFKKMWYTEGNMYVNRLLPKVQISSVHGNTPEFLLKISLIYNRNDSKCIIMQINNIVELNSIQLYCDTTDVVNRDVLRSDIGEHAYFDISNDRHAAEIFSAIFISHVLKVKRAFSPGEGRIITGVRLTDNTSNIVDFEVDGHRSYFDVLINEPRHTINIPSLLEALSNKYIEPLGMKKYILDNLVEKEHNVIEPLPVTGTSYNDKDVEYMKRAFYYSKFGTCDRLQVGAIVVKDGEMIGTGFNSALASTPTCNDKGHLMYDNSCKRTIHAEHNSIFAAIEAIGSIKGSVLYCTDRPCSDCMKLIATAGINKVYYTREYTPKYHLDLGVELIKLEV